MEIELDTAAPKKNKVTGCFVYSVARNGSVNIKERHRKLNYLKLRETAKRTRRKQNYVIFVEIHF